MRNNSLSVLGAVEKDVCLVSSEGPVPARLKLLYLVDQSANAA